MKTPISFEFFPPKTPEGAEKLVGVRQKLYALKPEFFSVTYGAGGSTRERTHSTIARILKAGKAPGILVGEADGQRMLDAGALFVAVGSDVGLLRMSATNLAKKFKK